MNQYLVANVTQPFEKQKKVELELGFKARRSPATTKDNETGESKKDGKQTERQAGNMKEIET